jgi:hypothetical protein
MDGDLEMVLDAVEGRPSREVVDEADRHSGATESPGTANAVNVALVVRFPFNRIIRDIVMDDHIDRFVIKASSEKVGSDHNLSLPSAFLNLFH